jgi:hypothetical protein
MGTKDTEFTKDTKTWIELSLSFPFLPFVPFVLGT